MARSLKKGPFADPHLLKKIEAQADSEKKSVNKTWLVISWANSYQHVHSKATRLMIRRPVKNKGGN